MRKQFKFSFNMVLFISIVSLFFGCTSVNSGLFKNSNSGLESQYITDENYQNLKLSTENLYEQKIQLIHQSNQLMTDYANANTDEEKTSIEIKKYFIAHCNQ